MTNDVLMTMIMKCYQTELCPWQLCCIFDLCRQFFFKMSFVHFTKSHMLFECFCELQNNLKTKAFWERGQNKDFWSDHFLHCDEWCFCAECVRVPVFDVLRKLIFWQLFHSSQRKAWEWLAPGVLVTAFTHWWVSQEGESRITGLEWSAPTTSANSLHCIWSCMVVTKDSNISLFALKPMLERNQESLELHEWFLLATTMPLELLLLSSICKCKTKDRWFLENEGNVSNDNNVINQPISLFFVFSSDWLQCFNFLWDVSKFACVCAFMHVIFLSLFSLQGSIAERTQMSLQCQPFSSTLEFMLTKHMFNSFQCCASLVTLFMRLTNSMHIWETMWVLWGPNVWWIAFGGCCHLGLRVKVGATWIRRGSSSVNGGGAHLFCIKFCQT